MRFSTGAVFLVALCASITACDSAPGAEDAALSAPRVANLQILPDSVFLDNLPPGSVVDGIARFDVQVVIDVTDPDGDVDRVYVLLESPTESEESVASSEVEVPGDGRIQVTLDVEVPVAEIGSYPLRVHVSDRAGNLGNAVIGTLVLDATSEPPVIDTIDIPERVTLPAAGQPDLLIPIVAHVSDPDGIANILRVQMQIGSSTFNLCDDGGSAACNAGFPDSGDVTADDGLFTVTIALSSNNSPGSYEFAFLALDRAGLQSEPEIRTIIVE